MGQRINFRAKTKIKIERRAGHRCSFPQCGRGTSGPAAGDSGGDSHLGIAAHIYSASEQGPRGSLIPQGYDVSRVENGIWLCETHAKQVDANNGAEYPPQLLFLWKEIREADALVEMGDPRARAMHAVSSVSIRHLRQSDDTADDFKFGLKVPANVNLSARTVLYGRHLADASLIAHVINDGFARPRRIGDTFLGSGGAIEFSFEALRGPRRVEIATAVDGSMVEHSIDNERVFNIQGVYQPFLIDWPGLSDSMPQQDDSRDIWQRLGSATHLDPLVLRTLASSPTARSGEVLRRARVESDGSLLFMTRDDGIGRGVCYDNLSTGQQISVLLELCLLAAKAIWAPSIIIVSQLSSRLDAEHLESFQRQCAKAPKGTQILVIENTPGQGTWGRDWLRVKISREGEEQVTYGA